MREITGSATQGAVLRVLAAACAAVALAGCGTTVATKDALSDKDNYLATSFGPTNLSATVRTKVETGETVPERYRTARLAFTVQVEEEGKKSEVSATVDLTNAGKGYVQSRTEYGRNGVPYRVNLALTYAGIYRLKTQTLFVERPNGLLPNETKEVTRFDRGLANPKRGASYAIDSKTGTSVQVANYLTENFACTTGNPGPASAILASLTGEALPIDCTVVGANNVVVSRVSYSWLYDYGLAIEREAATSRTKSTYVLTALSTTK